VSAADGGDRNAVVDRSYIRGLATLFDIFFASLRKASKNSRFTVSRKRDKTYEYM